MKQAYSIRRKLNNSKNIDAIDRLDNFIASKQTSNLLWHRSCYAIFTYKNEIEQLLTKQTSIPQQDVTCSATYSIPMGPRLRKDVKPVDWNLCIFCQSLETKAHLRGVMTKNMSEDIIKSAYLDYKVSIRLAGVIDLIAAEAKYQLTCFSSFTRSTTKVKQQTSTCDLTMIWLCPELRISADRGHILSRCCVNEI